MIRRIPAHLIRSTAMIRAIISIGCLWPVSALLKKNCLESSFQQQKFFKNGLAFSPFQASKLPNGFQCQAEATVGEKRFATTLRVSIHYPTQSTITAIPPPYKTTISLIFWLDICTFVCKMAQSQLETVTEGICLVSSLWFNSSLI